MKFLIIFFLLCSPCLADTTIKTARKQLTIKDGDVLQQDSMWVGTVENISDVTFVKWNFAREVPHTVVFKNCHNLTFIDCNLANVELQDDFTIKGSLTLHVEEYEQNGKKYRKVECGDNKTRIYEKIISDIDVVEKDFPDLTKAQKDLMKQKITDAGGQVIEHTEKQELKTVEDTPNDKKIKGIRISPNTAFTISK
jgi:hypothetical protein